MPSRPLLVGRLGERLNRQAATSIVRRLAKRAGVTKHISPHSLRHSFITAALDAGCRCGMSRSPPATPIPALAQAWAESVVEPRECRWSRYLTWAWVVWIAGSAALALAFGDARDVALHLLIFDVMLLFIALLRITRRRAHAVLAAIGDLVDSR